MWDGGYSRNCSSVFRKVSSTNPKCSFTVSPKSGQGLLTRISLLHQEVHQEAQLLSDRVEIPAEACCRYLEAASLRENPLLKPSSHPLPVRPFCQ